VDEIDALLDVVLEALNGLLQELLLLVGDTLQGVEGLLGTVGAKLNGNGEEVNASLLGNGIASGNARKVDVAGLDEALFALGSPQDLLGEAETSVGHGESGRATAILGLDNLITAKLDAVDKSIVLVVGDGGGGRDLAEEWDNGVARVATNDGNGKLVGLRFTSDASNKGLSTDDVEGSDTKQLLGVEDLLGLEDLCRDGHGRVDGVRDDEDEGVGGDLGSNLDQALDDTSVDLEQIVTGHAGLAGNSCRNDNDVGVFEGSLRTVIGGEVASGLGRRRDVGKVGGNTGRVDNIVESQLVDEVGSLEEQREGLANATRGTSNDCNEDLLARQLPRGAC
jgi:hypothetical protein